MPVLRTTDGVSTAAFSAGDWAIACTVALIWGSSFLWTAIGLDALDPGAVAFLRVALGAAALWTYRPARSPVDRAAWPGILVVAVAGNAGPALLFALAQQRVDSSVAGMMNAATPLMVFLIGVLMTRRSPGSRQVIGLVIGFLGVALMASPNVAGADTEPLGIALVATAVVGYGLSNTVIVPLQQSYSASAIVGRALITGSLLLAPFGIVGLTHSSPTLESLVAVTLLGTLGTGAARALNATLAGRAGATRGSVTTYLVPVIAIALGVTFRGDSIQHEELAGTALVLVGAALVSRRQQRTAPPNNEPGAGTDAGGHDHTRTAAALVHDHRGR
jgi:drug/metabolite transporter (DMT)-like permease